MAPADREILPGEGCWPCTWGVGSNPIAWDFSTHFHVGHYQMHNVIDGEINQKDHFDDRKLRIHIY